MALVGSESSTFGKVNWSDMHISRRASRVRRKSGPLIDCMHMQNNRNRRDLGWNTS